MENDTSKLRLDNQMKKPKKIKKKNKYLHAQNPITKPFVALFNFFSNHISYTFAVAFITAIGGFLIAAYIGTFIASTVNFRETRTDEAFIRLFILLCLAEYAPLYFLHFGILTKWKIPAFTPSLRLINKHLRHGQVLGISHENTLKDFYIAIEKLPLSNMKAAAIYPSIVLFAVTIQELIIGSMKNAFFIFLGIASAIVIYVFYTFVIAELLTGDLRRKVKRLMLIRRISFEEKSFSSIKKKFIFVSILVLMAMIELGLMFVNQQSDKFSYLPWIYIFMTVVVVGSLMFFYLVSIEDALREIETAAIDLGRGGKGKLYGRSMDKEFIRMSKGIVSAAYEVNEIRNNLEQKVKERTDELQKSLAEIRILKEKQDGDYFLTSLLTEALNNINKAHNKEVQVEFIVREKKQFSFRKWNKEIGGDMCMAHSINLRGRPYTMVLNADAMGKSIQGAGGVLVMGSVLKYLAEATKGSNVKNRLYPEFWIRDTYQELQSIFESFNGSMLMSLVMGLVDEKSGLFYFINAEHPWVILYREGKASFIEDDLTLRKIGTQGIKQTMRVQIFQMLPNDVLIAGSDGRDDVIVGFDEQNQIRIINEDENAILGHVTKAKADMNLLEQEITNFGELTDDLSLLKIHYKPGTEKEIQLRRATHTPLIEQAKNLYKEKQFQKAIDLLEQKSVDRNCVRAQDMLTKLYMQISDYGRAYYYAEKAHHGLPEEERYLYITSLCAKKIKNWKKAMDHGERLHLRNPENIKNLINLADSYRQADMPEKAWQLIKEADEIEKDNLFTVRLRQKMASMKSSE